MQTESLDTLHQARPFRAFTLHISDGRNVRVAHPELLAHGEQTLVVFEQPGNRMRVIDLTLVTEIEISNEATHDPRSQGSH